MDLYNCRLGVPPVRIVRYRRARRTNYPSFAPEEHASLLSHRPWRVGRRLLNSLSLRECALYSRPYALGVDLGGMLCCVLDSNGSDRSIYDSVTMYLPAGCEFCAVYKCDRRIADIEPI